jgi:dienelactone hydrolase
MTKLYAFVLVPLVLTLTVATAWGQASGGPEIVVVHSGSATLHAMLWRPQGSGPFPAILLNHGSGRTQEDLERLGPYERNAEKLGPVFARHGYVFLYLFRRGVGLSADQGSNAVDLMNSESAAHGQEARNALQLQLLENREMDDALSGLKFLRALPYVDARNVAVIGHSFGGSLTVLLAEREPNLRAVVIFSAAGYSFDRSPELRARLLAAKRKSFWKGTRSQRGGRSPKPRRGESFHCRAAGRERSEIPRLSARVRTQGEMKSLVSKGNRKPALRFLPAPGRLEIASRSSATIFEEVPF